MAEADLDQVLSWRNSERIRRAMYTDHIISPEEHRAWFSRARQTGSSSHFIFECEGIPIGVVNVTDIDPLARRCNWGFYVGAENAPRGGGSAMGFFALEHLFEKLNFRKVVGEALGSNNASVKYHQRLGFVQEGRLVEHVLKDGESVDVISFAIFDRDWYEIKGRLAAKFFDDGR